MKKIHSIIIVFLLVGFCISDCKKNESGFHNQITDKYLGIWDFKYVWSVSDLVIGTTKVDSTTFTGVINPGPSDGYITIVYAEDVGLTKKVETDGKILNECVPQLHGTSYCTGYFEGDTVLHFITYRMTPPNQIKEYITTLTGKKISSINTLSQKPTVTTGNATSASTSFAIFHGIVNPNFSVTNVYFEYGTSTRYSDIVPALSDKVEGCRDFAVSANLSDLKPGTEYHFRVKAVNMLGIIYGSDMKFNTYLPGTVTDIDGNVYNTVQIDSKVWMDGNLKVTRFNDGTTIPLVTENSSWQNLITPGFTWFDKDVPAIKGNMGALYNWYAVNTSRLCPSGWHVPDVLEWQALENIQLLTEMSNGIRRSDGTFYVTQVAGNIGYEWTSTQNESYQDVAWRIYIQYEFNSLYKDITLKKSGIGVHCIKDN